MSQVIPQLKRTLYNKDKASKQRTSHAEQRTSINECIWACFLLWALCWECGAQTSISLKDTVQLWPNEQDTMSALRSRQPLTIQFPSDAAQTTHSLYLLLKHQSAQQGCPCQRFQPQHLLKCGKDSNFQRAHHLQWQHRHINCTEGVTQTFNYSYLWILRL